MSIFWKHQVSILLDCKLLRISSLSVIWFRFLEISSAVHICIWITVCTSTIFSSVCFSPGSQILGASFFRGNFFQFFDLRSPQVDSFKTFFVWFFDFLNQGVCCCLATFWTYGRRASRNFQKKIIPICHVSTRFPLLFTFFFLDLRRPQVEIL